MKGFCFLWLTILMLPSNEGKSLSVEQHLKAFGHLESKSRIQKRDYDYFYYDYDGDEPEYISEIHPTIPPPTPPPPTTVQSHFDGFKTFMDGLKKLQEALDNPDYDWGIVKKTPSDTVADLPMVTHSSETYTPPSDIHELLVLVRILKQLSLSKQHTTTTTTAKPSPNNLLESAGSMLNRILYALKVEVSPEERHHILSTLAPEGKEGSVQEAVAEVSQLFNEVFGELAVSLPPPDMASLDDPALLLNMTMQLMQDIEDEFERKMQEEHRTESSPDQYERLRSIIQELHSLSDGLAKPTTRREARTTETPKLTEKKTNEEPCTLPYVDVAYKVCILPVLDRQLSWHDARQYCRSRGLELVMDSAVIKGRKHFNYQLGETGSRERWTLWVGGRKDDEGKWEWIDGIPVPSFLWSKNQPRTYDRDSIPAGTCMAIHGFSEYYGTALPCHHRRRFVCQKM